MAYNTLSLEIDGPVGRLTSDGWERLLLGGLLATAGITKFFYGYVETGPLLTAGGVLFLSSATRNLYAFDKKTGDVLTTIPLDGYGYGNPITYRTASGKQLIVIASSEKDGSNAKLNAFALSD